jgi:3-isopropylmalate/(R)-2-methylmalate dehydratase large subunit
MAMTLAEKILANKCRKEKVVPGEIVIAPVDCAMMTDILGPRIIIDELNRLGKKIKNPDKVVLVADHYTPSATEHQAEIVKFSRKWAKDNGVRHFFELEGPCHQLLAEKGFSRPGDILVGTDSHSCTSGAFGCFGTGIGSTEMLGVLLRGEIWFRVPESIRICWRGKLQKGVMAKDIILRTIGEIGHAGATYKSMEFCGDTIMNLPMDERICISNMAVEAGAKVGLIPADEKTVEYMERHGVADAASAPRFRADEDADYCLKLEFNAAELPPVAACPHEVDNVKPVREIEGLFVDQVYIGSCTGGRISDLSVAAGMLAGRRVAEGCRLLFPPPPEPSGWRPCGWACSTRWPRPAQPFSPPPAARASGSIPARSERERFAFPPPTATSSEEWEANTGTYT